MIYFKNVTKTRYIGICSLELFNCVFIVKSTNYICTAITVSQGLLCSVSRSLCTSLTFHDSFSKFLGQCVHEGVSWRRPLLCTCSPYILWSSLRGKKRKILKVREELRLGTCQSTFFLLLAPLPSPTATAPHYASQNRRIYFCILFKNIKLLRPIFGHFWHFFPVEDLREIKRKF